MGLDPGHARDSRRRGGTPGTPAGERRGEVRGRSPRASAGRRGTRAWRTPMQTSASASSAPMRRELAPVVAGRRERAASTAQLTGLNVARPSASSRASGRLGMNAVDRKVSGSTQEVDRADQRLLLAHDAARAPFESAADRRAEQHRATSDQRRPRRPRRPRSAAPASSAEPTMISDWISDRRAPAGRAGRRSATPRRTGRDEEAVHDAAVEVLDHRPCRPSPPRSSAVMTTTPGREEVDVGSRARRTRGSRPRARTGRRTAAARSPAGPG